MTDPQQRILHVNYKKLGLAAAIGLIIYVLFNFTTLFQSEMTEQQSHSLISESRAEASASSFAADKLGISEPLGEASVSYRSDSNLYGYLSRAGKVSEYDKTYLERFPYEMFRVVYHYTADGSERVLQIDVGAQTGRVVAFSDLLGTYASQLTDGEAFPISLEDQSLLPEDKEAIARPLMSELGLNPDELTPVSSDTEDGLRYTSPSARIGESELGVNVTFEEDRVASIRASFSVPSSYTEYIERQSMWAGVMTYGGYMLLTFVLGVLAIVYAFLLKKYTSFLRGIFLSLFYYVVSVFSVWNARPYFEGNSYSDVIFFVTLILQAVIGLFMAASLYFSFVAGDALWRSQGRNMWARRGEPAYGRHVWEAAKTGYLWALILLAVQAVIFFVLERSLGVFSTTDDSQSTYNMMYPWLFPILAWMAGISEEAIYRLFGIPMVKKIVRSTVLASIITSLIWAFGHTLYPIYPVITRPIELLFLGLLFSFIFLRYGYITAMFAHVVFDSILMGLSLIFMGTLNYVIVGIVSIVLPAIVAYAIYLIYCKDKPRPAAGGSPGGGQEPRREEIRDEDPLRDEPHPESGTSAPREPLREPGEPSRRTPGWSLGKDGRPDSV
ncbi:CPBP family intramembrane glutamic endopeptidase [Saccharibacillus alkalitolerans]|uniref:CPBP family intramembrane metalloprotease n=1 Tax=Saccharibacillus alkalitolerans TaxID=2705290 RepID=A0ABX0F9R8_9BACL|nr:type II CAAX endopeptidase family protein [Saccharibacillus alkalitolerans]NGZ76774.1 CPBP family intramembrane metalloprotease [Saccharibacillus alkalitolerans]